MNASVDPVTEMVLMHGVEQFLSSKATRLSSQPLSMPTIHIGQHALDDLAATPTKPEF